MQIFAIGDTHLSRARPKPMDIFGEQWRNHDEQIRENWNSVATDADILLIAGDISWALRLEEARADLDFLAGFRGRKLLLKGNHDYWWSSLARMRAVAPAGIDFLQNDAHIFDGVAVAGTRGWSLPAASAPEPDLHHFRREVERLRLSLADLRGRDYETLVVMLHYPPLAALDQPTEFSEVIEAAGASLCVYGHLHGRDIATAAEGERRGVTYKLVSADAVHFRPWQVWPKLLPPSPLSWPLPSPLPRKE